MLFATGLLKLLSLRQEILFFTFADPVLPFLTNWQITALTGVTEIVASLMLFAGGSLAWRLLVLTGLTCGLLAYRLGFYWINPQAPCPCYGGLLGWLPEWMGPWIRSGFGAALLGMMVGCVWFNLRPVKKHP